MKLIKDNLILLAILFIGLILRIYDLGDERIWIDEGISVEVAHLHLPQILYRLSNGDHHPPFYFAILHYWVALFGDSEVSIRLISMVFGCFSIVIIYKVGGLLFNKKVGLLSSLLLALSLFHISYSQEARPYALMVLLTSISFYFFIKLINSSDLSVSIGYILSSTLLLYTHNSSFFVIIAQNIYIISLFLLSEETEKLRWKKWFWVQIVVLMLYAPWVPSLINQLLRVKSGFWVSMPTILKIMQTFGSYSSYSYSLLVLFLLLSFFSILPITRISGQYKWKDFFHTVSSFSWKLRFSDVKMIYLLLIWLITPIILPFIISRILNPIYIHRVTMSASLAFYILIANGIEKISSKSIKSIIVIFIVVVSLFGAVRRYYTKTNKPDWKEVATYIDKNAKEGDVILFYPPWIKNLVFDYYSKRTDLLKIPVLKNTKGFYKGNLQELGPILEDYNRVWVIRYQQDNKELMGTLNESYDLSDPREYMHYELSGRKAVYVDLSLFIKKTSLSSILLNLDNNFIMLSFL